jgi:hypothetical protein
MPRLTKSWKLVQQFDAIQEANDFIATKQVHKRSSKAGKSGAKVEYECTHKKKFRQSRF